MAIKINYKGTCTDTLFEYKCTECANISEILQKASEDMDNRKCTQKKCKGKLIRYHSSPPSLTAEMRERNLTRNLNAYW